MESTSPTKVVRMPFLNFNQSLVRSKIDNGLLLTDEDYEEVVKDCDNWFGVNDYKFSYKDVIEYIELKYGTLNLHRLNRVAEKYHANIQ